MNRKQFRSTALATALACVGLVTTAQPAQASSFYGCPSGYACLYTDNTDTLGATHPHTDYFYYGYYNLSNVIGNHYLVNNQTGGARVYPCYGYNGTNCTVPMTGPNGGTIYYLPAGYDVNLNFTPINSLKLCASAC